MPETPEELDLVLAGGGHSHVAVLRRMAMKPWPGVRVTVISREVHTPYSGMLPGHVAGFYDRDQVHIDLGPLAARAGARLIHAGIDGLDAEARRLHLPDRPPLRYDLLSINTGSTPVFDDVEGARERVIPVKPISSFLPRLDALLERVASSPDVLDIAVVGAGPGGVELVLSLERRLADLGLRARARLHLVCAGPGPLEGSAPGVIRRFRRVLGERAVRIHVRARVATVDDQVLRTSGGDELPADEVLWVTHAGAPSWSAASGLALDPEGFIEVGPTLQSCSHDNVFAAGDVVRLTHAPRPRSGVYAVRAGPVLARNLEAWIRGRSLRAWRPQRRALYLVTTGERSAVVLRPGLPAFAGHWVWRWKDWIDRRFMHRFTDLPPMADRTPASMVARQRGGGLASGMRCTGCGSKIGSTTLTAALGDSGETPQFEDAALLEVGGVRLQQTIDGFPLPVSDPWLGGRIATLHALGDLHAMGAQAVGALALATVPWARRELMESDLAQLMAGVRRELERDGCPLLGGHSCEGAAMALGLSVTGRLAAGETPLAKSAGRPGDVLILTKPLGTGVVLAGTEDGRLPSRNRDCAIASMLRSNRKAIAVLRAHGCGAATDVTGFGLLGHALEMADASRLDLRLDVTAPIPLPGALEGLEAGVVSSLQQDNESALTRADLEGWTPGAARVRLLCDPQTAGGLLAAVPEDRAGDCVRDLKAAGFDQAVVVGRFVASAAGQEIRVGLGRGDGD
jgi:selenide,water dikinase